MCKKEHDAFGGHICAGRTVAAISTDAIKYCIKWVSPEIPKKDYNGNMPSIAREQLAALISENEKLKARVKEQKKLEDGMVRSAGEALIAKDERIATLEQQLNDAQNNLLNCKCVQIYDAEKRILVWVIENKNTTMLDVTDVDRIHGEYKQIIAKREE